MELVNPNSAFTWQGHLDIHGVPMRGTVAKQSVEFYRAGWLAHKADPTIDPDKFGAMMRRQVRPLSLPTLERARGEYARKEAPRAPAYWLVETVGGVCARRCPFCSINTMVRYDEHGNKAKAGMLPWDAWMKFLSECGEYGPYGCSAYQLGEPMNYSVKDADGNRRDIGDLIETAKRVGKFKIINVSTHADVTNLPRLLECDVDDVIVSLDAVTPETYAKNRPATNGKQEGAFERTIERLREFLALKAERGSGRPYVVAQIINSGLTRDEVLPFIREWIATDGIDTVSVKQLDSMLPWLNVRMVDEAEEKIKADKVRNMPCQHLWAIGSLTHTGVMNACAHDAFTQLTDGSSIYNTTIFDFWNGKFMSELRAEHLAGAKRLPCSSCNDRDPWLG